MKKKLYCALDETYVSSWVISPARTGQNAAKEQLRKLLEGRELSNGLKEAGQDDVVVSLRELAQLGVVDSVTIGTKA